MFSWLQRYSQSPVKKKPRGETGPTQEQAKRPGSARGRPGKSAKSGKSGTGKGEGWECHECKEIFENEEDELLTCSSCDKHWCTKCIDMSTDVYAAVQRPDLLWFCPPCAKTVKMFLNMGVAEERNKIESLQEDVQAKLSTFEEYLEKKLSAFEQKLEEKPSAVPDKIKETWAAFQQKLEEKASAMPDKLTETWAGSASKHSSKILPLHLRISRKL